MAKAVPTSAMAQVEEGAAEIESIEQSMGALTTITEQSEGINGLSASMGSKVRQWLHSAAKEISKSSLAWLVCCVAYAQRCFQIIIMTVCGRGIEWVSE